jgi:hypothetical protein
MFIFDKNKFSMENKKNEIIFASVSFFIYIVWYEPQ